MDGVGTKIRIERKEVGLILKELGKKVRFWFDDPQRIETGKRNPSVVLISEIAHNLKKPIHSFFKVREEPFIGIKRKNQRSISSPILKIKITGPRNKIRDNIIETYGELKKGKRVDPHTNRGIEFNYNIERKAELKMNGQFYFM